MTTTRAWPVAVVLALGLGASPRAVLAQTAPGGPLGQNPPGAVGGWLGGHRPPDPNRTSHQVSITADATGGHEENAEIAGLGLPIDPDAQLQTGTIAHAEVGLRYRLSRRRHQVEALATARGTRFERWSNWPLFAGLLRGDFGLGSKSGLRSTFSAAEQPAFIAIGTTVIPFLDDFGDDTDTPTEPSEPAQPLEPADVGGEPGLVRQQWLMAQGAVNVYRSWTNSHRTELEAGRSLRRPLDGAGLRSEMLTAGVRHSWRHSESNTARISYRRDETRLDVAAGQSVSLVTHTSGLTWSLIHRLSPSRRIELNVMGGATLSDFPGAVRDHSIEPTAMVGLRTALSRRWIAEAQVGRVVTPLEGVSPEPFATIRTSTRLQGSVGRRLSIDVSGDHFTGAGLTSNAGSFTNTIATARIDYALAPTVALTSSYVFYRHELRDLSTQPSGFPGRYDRRAVRVGLTFFLPVFGTF